MSTKKEKEGVATFLLVTRSRKSIFFRFTPTTGICWKPFGIRISTHMVPETFASFLVDQKLQPLAAEAKLINIALFSAAFMYIGACILAMQLPLVSSHAVCNFSCYEDFISQVNMFTSS